MECVRAVNGCAAVVENVVAFDKEVYVLEAYLLWVVITAVNQMTAKLPFVQIIRADQREQIAPCSRLGECV